MHLHDLNNTQLILLVLFVSFVTSIATGVTTVTLLEEAPPVITQTINRVVEKTVEVVSPPKQQPVSMVTQTVVVKEEEFITKAAEKNGGNVVELGRLKKRFRVGGIGRPPVEEFELELLGTAFVLNSHFAISQQKQLADAEGIIIKTPGNHFYRVIVAATDAENNLTLFSVGDRVNSASGIDVNSESHEFAAVAFTPSDKIKIGQTTISLGIQDGVILALGVISHIKTKSVAVSGGEGRQEIVSIQTTNESNRRYAGGPLIGIDGDILGVIVVLENGEHFAVPAYIIEAIMEQIKSKPVVSAASS